MRILVLIIMIAISISPGQFNGTPATNSLGAVETQSEEGVLELSLKQVQDYAVNHNAVAENARLDVKSARKKIWETTTIGLPQISGTVSYRNDLKIATTLIPAQFLDPNAGEGEFIGVKFGTQHNATAELKLDQLIFSGSYIVALRASKIYLRLSQENVVKTEIEVKHAVTDTYYLILLALHSKATLAANLENVKKTKYETTEMYKAGFLEDTDADQLQLTVTELENSIKSIDRQINVTYNLLKFQMGVALERHVRLTESLTDILSQIDKDSLLTEQFNLSRHIDFRMADSQERSMFLLMKREQSEYLPTISAYATYTRMAMRDEFNFFKKNDEQWFPSTSIGLRIAVPLFSSGMRAARVAQAKIDLKKATNTKNQVKDGLELGLLQARSTFADAYDTVDSTRKNTALAKKIYEKSGEKFKKGTVSSMELTQAHSQYLAAENNYTRAVVELLKAKTLLDKAMNRL